MQRLIGLLIIAVVIVMLALAGNTIFRNVPLDGTWSLFLGGVIATVMGLPEVASRLREKQERAGGAAAADAAPKGGEGS